MDSYDITYGQEDMRLDFKKIMRCIDSNIKSTKHVLVVDDDRLIRTMVKYSIEKSSPNLEAICAENGSDALRMLKEMRKNGLRDPVFIITDLNMPVMDGWEFIHELYKDYTKRKKKFGIPIIVLTDTTGEKGMIFKKSIHGGKSSYDPLITVAKEACKHSSKFDAKGEKGLQSWIKHFLQYGRKH